MAQAGWLPPGQSAKPSLWVGHYGPVPRGDPATWTLSFTVEDAEPPPSSEPGDRPPPTSAPPGDRPPSSPRAARLIGRTTVAELPSLGRAGVTSDFHCAAGRSVGDLAWTGTPTAALLAAFPPPAGVVGVMVYGEYGYSANVRVEDLALPTSLLATHLDGAPLTPEHGWPVRLVIPHLYTHKGPKWFRGWEYLIRLRRGFWEERGHHLIGQVWADQRYSFQE